MDRNDYQHQMEIIIWNLVYIFLLVMFMFPSADPLISLVFDSKSKVHFFFLVNQTHSHSITTDLLFSIFLLYSLAFVPFCTIVIQLTNKWATFAAKKF